MSLFFLRKASLPKKVEYSLLFYRNFSPLKNTFILYLNHLFNIANLNHNLGISWKNTAWELVVIRLEDLFILHSHLLNPQNTVIIQPLNYKILQTETQRTLTLLEQSEQDPDITQASLATQLGVAVGTVNRHIKRMVEKGIVKVERAQRRKLRYSSPPKASPCVQKELGTFNERGYKKIRVSGNGKCRNPQTNLSRRRHRGRR